MSYLDVGKESEPYDLFVFTINGEQTRQTERSVDDLTNGERKGG